MTIWRDWTGTNSVTGKPRPGATHSWWHYCHDCHKLTGPVGGPVGPRGWVADSDEGVPDVVADALRHQCKPERTKTRPERAPQREVRVNVKPRWTADEDAVVLANSVADAARILKRSRASVQSRRKRMIRDGTIPRSIHADKRRPWTEEENRLAATLPLAEVVKLTGRSVKSVRCRQWDLARRDVPKLAS